MTVEGRRSRRRIRADSRPLALQVWDAAAALVSDHALVLAVAIPGLLALALGLYQLFLPNVLFGVHAYTGIGYDDGVYTGAAVRLVHGVLPYRDFALVHPPGVPLVISPIAALGRLLGTDATLAGARVLTVVVAGLNASLAALAVRHRGLGAMFLSGIGLATFPLAVAADQTVLLEPYLVLFCLLGVVAMFSGGAVASSRRVVLAGLAFGFAGAVKIWAIIPIVVAVVVCLPAGRRALRALLFGVVAGFVIPCAPFFAAAPGAFVHEVVVDNLSRVAPGGAALSVLQRLETLTGLSGWTVFQPGTGFALGVTMALAALVALVYVSRRRETVAADWFVLGASITVTLAMLFASDFSDHFAYFPAAFVAMLVGITVSRGVVALAALDLSILRRFGGGAIAVGIGLTAAVVLVPQQASYARTYLASAEDPSSTLSSLVPKGSCVVLDEVTFALVAERFDPGSSGCPAVVDPYGQWFSTFPSHLPPYPGPYPPQFVATWGQWLNRADYVVLTVPQSDIIPWSSALTSWFDTDFRLEYREPGMNIYQHVGHSSPPGAASSLSADQLVEQGLAAERSGDTNRAFADYEAAAAEDPANKYARYDLGYIYQERGDVTDAAAQYRAALLIDPKFTDALYNLGVLEAPVDPAAAISYYEQDLQLDPNNASANFNLGVLLIRQGQSSLGRSYLDRALHLNPALSAHLPTGISP